MTGQQQKVLEIASLVVIVIGVIVWYSTPADVVVGPLLIVLLGAAGAGVARLARRREDERATSELADRVRAERERDRRGPEA